MPALDNPNTMPPSVWLPWDELNDRDQRVEIDGLAAMRVALAECEIDTGVPIQ